MYHILDMDLDPDDQDLYSREEVSRYQHEDTKRRIIRLEQGAYSYLQRAIASHGAFAILYGRHSKHYIKKPEVLLGRATEDAIVDIDLGREGRGNKISRQQAMIKMDKGGSFYLKNLGKCSISVNSKEVAPRQSLSLSSSCLIEIRGMPFIFETNQTRVKQYMDSVTKGQRKGKILFNYESAFTFTG
ncbi:Forkhead-associated domain-containing protein [Prunus dulcis]|uniref:Forkhead-associated domain-containing protein n=1 Tax=Prunus dulcis TaxID=3755 RepID=A0A4Y1QSP4_PRUDU|nr:Forkhead-associated domain-containing protein [Prunus dulcis]